MIRRFGKPPRPDIPYIRRPGVYALLLKGDDLLLTLQSRPAPDIQLPGGGIDPGESPISALHREVFEETGWTISRPRRIGAFRRFVYMPEYDLFADKLCTIYMAAPVRRLGPPVEPDHKAVWMSKHAAVKALGNAGDRHFARLLI